MATIEYERERVCKNSIRYKKTSSAPGPATVYMPNECFEDLGNPPDVITIDVKQFWKKS